MNISELRETLITLDIPVRYRAFNVGEVPSLPYLLYYTTDNQGTLKADNHNYAKAYNLTLELYSEEKDLELEEKLEALLDANNIEYDTFESYLDTESMYEVAYDITI